MRKVETKKERKSERERKKERVFPALKTNLIKFALE